MRFLLSCLNHLHKEVPYLFGVLGMSGAAFYAFDHEVNFKLFLGIGLVVGYVLGFFIKKIIPNPDEKAL